MKIKLTKEELLQEKIIVLNSVSNEQIVYIKSIKKFSFGCGAVELTEKECLNTLILLSTKTFYDKLKTLCNLDLDDIEKTIKNTNIEDLLECEDDINELVKCTNSLKDKSIKAFLNYVSIRDLTDKLNTFSCDDYKIALKQFRALCVPKKKVLKKK